MSNQQSMKKIKKSNDNIKQKDFKEKNEDDS